MPSEVVHVEQTTGPRGGRVWMLTLSCGHRMWRTGRSTPPQSVECVPCHLDEQDDVGKELVDEIVTLRTQNRILRGLLERWIKRDHENQKLSDGYCIMGGSLGSDTKRALDALDDDDH